MTCSVRADVVITGRKLPWTATIPDGWIGGTAEDIERILAKAGANSAAKRSLDEILEKMLAESKQLDAFFLHLDVTGADTLSMLRVNVVQENLEPFAEEAHRKSVWAEYAKTLPKDVPAGSKVEVTRDRSTMTGGRKAYEATFLTTLPNGGKVYTVLHMVAYGAGRAHIFQLKADGRKFRARFAEFAKILDSLNYRSELTSTTLAGPEVEVTNLAERLRGNKEALMKLKPTAGQIAEIAANDEDAKALSAYVEQLFARIPAAGINGNPGQAEILVYSGRLSTECAACDDLPGGYTMYATHFKKGVAIYGFKYVVPGETTGMAFDGLVKLGEGWVMIPKAWRAFEK